MPRLVRPCHVDTLLANALLVVRASVRLVLKRVWHFGFSGNRVLYGEPRFTMDLGNNTLGHSNKQVTIVGPLVSEPTSSVKMLAAVGVC